MHLNSLLNKKGHFFGITATFVISGGKSEKKKNKGKGKANPKSSNVVSSLSREVDSDIVIYIGSEDEEEKEIIYSVQTKAPFVAMTRLGNPYHKNYDKLAARPSQLPPSEPAK